MTEDAAVLERGDGGALALLDRAMSKVSVAQMTGVGGFGSFVTYMLKQETLATMAGLLTVILLLLKIVHEVRSMFGKAKD